MAKKPPMKPGAKGTKMTTCPDCGKKMPATAKRCPSCGMKM